MNAGISIEIINVTIPLVSIATVLVAWLKHRSSRKIIVIDENNKMLHTEGLTVKEFTSLLSSFKTLRAIETKKPDE